MKRALTIAITLLPSTILWAQVQWAAPFSIINNSETEISHDTAPKVAVDPDGKIAVAWISQHGEGTSVSQIWRSNVHIAYSQTSGASWTDAVNISDPRQYNSEVDIAAGQTGEFLFAWTSGDLFSDYRLHSGSTNNFGSNYTTETIVGQDSRSDFDYLSPQVAKLANSRTLIQSSWHFRPAISGPSDHNMDGHIWHYSNAPSTLVKTRVLDDPSSNFQCNTLSVELLNAGDVNLIAFFHQDYVVNFNMYNQQPLVLNSNDGGISWTSRGRPTPPQYKLQECSAAWGANGTCIMFAAEQDLFAATERAFFYRSDDNGSTWGTGQSITPAPMTVDSLSNPSIATDGNGTWLAVISGRYRGSTLPNFGTDSDILYSMSTDNGLTWSDFSTVNPDAENDTAIDLFPQASYLGDNKWGVFWAREENNDSDIVLSIAAPDSSMVSDWPLF